MCVKVSPEMRVISHQFDENIPVRVTLSAFRILAGSPKNSGILLPSARLGAAVAPPLGIK